jgi:hypothetical protein
MVTFVSKRQLEVVYSFHLLYSPFTCPPPPQSAGIVKEAFLPMLHATGNIEDGSLFAEKKREIYVMRVGDSLERKGG